MSVVAPHLGLPLSDWFTQPERFFERQEVVDGELVVKKVGGNPHHFIAQQLAQAFMRQWADCYAVAPGYWVLEAATADTVELGRIPDVLVNGPRVISDPKLSEPPMVAVEIWSPGNTLQEMNDKRREYRTHGLPALLEGFIDESGDVRLTWFNNDGRRWVDAAAAVGDEPLTVAGGVDDEWFQVVPNDLLNPTR